MYIFKQIYFLLVLTLLLVSGCFTKRAIIKPSLAATNNIKIKSAVTDSNQYTGNLAFLQPYSKKLQSKMGVVIGQCEAELKKEKPNSSLGNLVCDAMLFKAQQIDATCIASIANYGGIRLPSLSKGTVTLNSVYELMPFENTITIVPLTGVLIDSFCQKIALAGGMPISGIQFTMRNKKAESIIINNAPLQYNATYKVAVNSYMAAGGDNCEFLIAITKKNTSALIRDAIAEFIAFQNKNNKPLLALPVQRIITQ